jgi:hypothetical protein
MIVKDKELYECVKDYADKIYNKSSAYKSGFIIKTYKRFGGTFEDDGKQKPLKRWYREKWGDVGNRDYPVYRPSIRINKHTPLTINEIDKTDLKKKIEQKQKIKGKRNLSPFKKKSLTWLT